MEQPELLSTAASSMLSPQGMLTDLCLHSLHLLHAAGRLIVYHHVLSALASQML